MVPKTIPIVEYSDGKLVIEEVDPKTHPFLVDIQYSQQNCRAGNAITRDNPNAPNFAGFFAGLSPENRLCLTYFHLQKEHQKELDQAFPERSFGSQLASFAEVLGAVAAVAVGGGLVDAGVGALLAASASQTIAAPVATAAAADIEELSQGSDPTSVLQHVTESENAATDAANLCSANSFTGSTPVLLANGNEEPISTIRVGEKVLATDPETGRTEAQPVMKIIVHDGPHVLVSVILSDGSHLTATDHHPFWNVTRGAFTYAIDLHVGDLLSEPSGTRLEVAALQVFDEDITAYNLTVNDVHTYYAGTSPVLVHNSCGLDLDALARTGENPIGNQGMTKAGASLAQHADDLGFSEADLTGGRRNLNALGQDLLNDILSDPDTRVQAVTTGNNVGGSRFIGPDGAGATFDADGRFRYFGVYGNYGP